MGGLQNIGLSSDSIVSKYGKANRCKLIIKTEPKKTLFGKKGNYEFEVEKLNYSLTPKRSETLHFKDNKVIRISGGELK